MCTCASCSATDALADKGFDAWPRGNPAGRKSATDYAAHVSHMWHGIARGWEFKLGAAPTVPAWCKGAAPLPRPTKLVADFIASGYK